MTNNKMMFIVSGLEYLSAARSLHPELHAGSTLASQDFQLSLEGKTTILIKKEWFSDLTRTRSYIL